MHATFPSPTVTAEKQPWNRYNFLCKFKTPEPHLVFPLFIVAYSTMKLKLESEILISSSKSHLGIQLQDYWKHKNQSVGLLFWVWIYCQHPSGPLNILLRRLINDLMQYNFQGFNSHKLTPEWRKRVVHLTPVQHFYSFIFLSAIIIMFNIKPYCTRNTQATIFSP